MDILTYNEVKKLKQESKKNRFNEPCFATVSISSSTYWGTQVYDHNLNKIGEDKRWSESYHSYETSNGSELANSYYSQARSDSTTSTNSSTYGNKTCSVGHLGHNTIQVAPDGSFSFSYYNRDTQRDIGTWINNTTPNSTINLNDNKGNIGIRSYVQYQKNVPYGDEQIITGLNTSAKYGMISYNEKTQQLAIIESDTNYNIRLNVWTDVKPPSKFDNNSDFFGDDNLKPTNHTQTDYFTDQPSKSGSEGNYRGIVVMCDNGDVVFSRLCPSWGFYNMRFTYDETTGYNVPTQTEWQQSWTTVYGYEQGTSYGIRYQISNSGKYLIAYSASYYYGSGYYFTITEVSTGKTLHHHVTDSTYGYSFVPWRDDDFLMSKSINADGSIGVSLYPLTTKDQFLNKSTGDTFAIKSAIQNVIDNNHYSTDYPYIVPIMAQDYTKFIGVK